MLNLYWKVNKRPLLYWFILSMCILYLLSLRKKINLCVYRPYSMWTLWINRLRPNNLQYHIRMQKYYFVVEFAFVYFVNQWSFYILFERFLKRSIKFSGTRMHTYWKGLTVKNNVLNCKMFPVTFITMKYNNTTQHLEYLWNGTHVGCRVRGKCIPFLLANFIICYLCFIHRNTKYYIIRVTMCKYLRKIL